MVYYRSQTLCSAVIDLFGVENVNILRSGLLETLLFACIITNAPKACMKRLILNIQYFIALKSGIIIIFSFNFVGFKCFNDKCYVFES